MSSQLRIAIFPYIPDLAGDKLVGLKQFIADEFKKKCGESVQVETKADPYDLKKLTSTHLSNGEEAYDIMEVDTILLGELAKAGCLQPLEGHFKVTEDIYTASAVQSVGYSPHFKQHLYGVPTLQCASFLMELADKDNKPKEPLLKEWKSFDELKKALDKAESESGPKVLLAGDFRGSWGLPMFYLDAYVDKHGKGSVYEGIDAPVDPKLVEELKEYTDYGKPPGRDNPDTDGEFHDNHELLVNEVIHYQHILMYAYSENLGEVLQKATQEKKQKHALNIVSPALDRSNFLLTYTDAVVVNKSKFADPQRAEVIAKFVEFYTSLDFRKRFAFGQDLPESVFRPRYVLPARKAFFTEKTVAEDKYYKWFHTALQHSVAAPNHDIYQKREYLSQQLLKVLGWEPKAHTQLI